MYQRRLPAVGMVAMLSACFGTALGANSVSLADLSLEELMSIQVVTGAKKLQRVGDSASAVFVITADDIRRSGATSIPDALRLAPGVEVARFGSNKWAVSIRGSNGRFANKLLVLMDGRTLYTPLFAGVQWEMHDKILEDIERIEVIRGPGAALWGANAVNGVINIITRHARDTQGGQVSVAAGNVERGMASVRYGGKMDDGAWRVYAKGFARDAFPDAAGQRGHDDWSSGTAGFRIDKSVGGGELLVQGSAYRSNAGDQLTFSTLAAPFRSSVDMDQTGRGFNLLSRWEAAPGTGRGTSVQAFVEHLDFSFYRLNEQRSTFDVEVQRRMPVGAHDVIVGMGYRHTSDRITPMEVVTIHPRERATSLWSAFAQNEMTLVPERLRLTLGARAEHNGYTGLELQPSARLLWTPSPTQSVWASTARAVRTPARFEADGHVRLDAVPPFTAANPGPLPSEIALTGSRNFEAERLHSIELGYRQQFSNRAAFDVTAFQHQYDGLRSFVLGTPQPQLLALPPYVSVPMNVANGGSGHIRGIEFSAEYRPTDWWRLTGFISRQWSDYRTSAGPDTLMNGTSPEQTYSLRSSMNLGSDTELDLWVRHVGALKALGIPSYTSLDARLGWKVSRNVALSLVGQNLLDDRHPEFVSDFVGTATYQAPRAAYVKLDWKF